MRRPLTSTLCLPLVPKSWYEVVDETSLEQGDVLLGCPVFRVTMPTPSSAEHAGDGSTSAIDVLEEQHNLVVLTQSCDLVSDKVTDVLVAGIHTYQEFVSQGGTANTYIRGKSFREAAIKGNLPAQSLLPERLEPPSLPWSLVDFHHLFTIPKPVLMEYVSSSGQRLRLVPPYREHLAQAFARYLMRVGLPHQLDQFATVTLPPT